MSIPMKEKSIKVALVHDWLLHMRGGEKVLEALCEVFPQAEVYTLFFRRKKLSPALRKMKIHGSFLSYLPGITHYYRWLLPLFPFAVRTLRLRKADVVISSSHCVAKGVRIPKGALHICYCHTPVRYVWSFRKEYFGSWFFPLRAVIYGVLNALKRWDIRSNDSVHLFVANSENTRRRIRECYGRESEVIFPPVDTKLFASHGPVGTGDYFLVVSALVPYKRVDLAVQAFNRLGLRLLVVGEGPECKKLLKMASWHQEFLRGVTNERLAGIYAAALAIIFPGEEDFGIVPVEAQACGRPVIAYAKGGALESVTEKTGVFFQEQTIESLKEAVNRFQKMSFDPEAIRLHASMFDREVFKVKVTTFVARALEERQTQKH